MQPLSLPPGLWPCHDPGFLGDSGGQLLRALLPVRHGTGASQAGRRQLVLLPALGPPLCVPQAAWCCLPLLLAHAPPRYPTGQVAFGPAEQARPQFHHRLTLRLAMSETSFCHPWHPMIPSCATA